MRSSTLKITALVGLALAIAFAPVSVLARDCAVANLPPGVRLPDRPGCKGQTSAPVPSKPLRQGQHPGAIDLGNDTEVRISGRTRIDAEVKR